MRVASGRAWLLVALGCGCAAVQQAPPDATVVPPVAEIARTGCYGTCPVYRAVVYANGSVRYEGLANVSERGLHIGQIPLADVEAIGAAFTSLCVPSEPAEPQRR